MSWSKSRRRVPASVSDCGSHPAASTSHSAPMSITAEIVDVVERGRPARSRRASRPTTFRVGRGARHVRARTPALLSRLHVLFEVLDLRRARNRQDPRRAIQQPRERTGRVARELADVQRIPRDESDVVLLAVLEHRLPFAIGLVVAVLHGRDLEVLPRPLDLLDIYLGQPNVPDLPLALKAAQGVELLALLQTAVEPFAQPLRPCVLNPLAGTGPVEPAFVAITRSFGYGYNASAILPRDAHRAEAEPVDCEIAADGEGGVHNHVPPVIPSVVEGPGGPGGAPLAMTIS